jgi:hypothetical protein
MIVLKNQHDSECIHKLVCWENTGTGPTHRRVDRLNEFNNIANDTKGRREMTMLTPYSLTESRPF